MNLPNKLTVLRVCLAPLFLVLLLLDQYFWAGLIFAVASFTDYLDGQLARKQNIVTNMGKFLDPLADKMLTTAAFLGFLAQGWLDSWAVFIILSREFVVTSVRLLAAREGTVVAASFWGKLKTVSQIISILVMLVSLEVIKQGWLSSVFLFGADAEFLLWGFAFVLIWISVVFTVISGGQYFWQYRHVFTEKN